MNSTTQQNPWKLKFFFWEINIKRWRGQSSGLQFNAFHHHTTSNAFLHHAIHLPIQWILPPNRIHSFSDEKRLSSWKPAGDLALEDWVELRSSTPNRGESMDPSVSVVWNDCRNFGQGENATVFSITSCCIKYLWTFLHNFINPDVIY